MSYQHLLQALKGGAGLGNFDHSGRPGKIGGSAGGSGHITTDKGTITGPTTVLEAVSQPTHPMYRAYMHGNTNFESEDFARINVGVGTKSGQYLLTREGSKFQVNGQPKGTAKKLLKKYNSVPEALEAIEDHFANRTIKRIESGTAEWFKKYPETKPLRD